METVEVVIRLSKFMYNNVVNYLLCGNLASAIREGTVLPKGHGRLVDADKISRVNYAEEDNLTGYGMTYDEMGAYNDGINDMYRRVKNAPTVIEVDKEVENE